MPRSIPFCVNDRAFVVWGQNVHQDCADFLRRLDRDFYQMTAEVLLGHNSTANTAEADEPDDGKERRAVSSMVRLLWHHGVETLLMLLGAYVQAPRAVHGYFLKCRTEDILEIGRGLLSDRPPSPNWLDPSKEFSLEGLLAAIHDCAPWPDRDETLAGFREAVSEILTSFTSEAHRSEYNSLKHGLRASHGAFVFRVGREEQYGVPPPEEAMHTMGSSEDSSYFQTARPLTDDNGSSSRVNFSLGEVSIAWSLQRAFFDLQLLSTLIGNTISALYVYAGDAAGTQRFTRPADRDFWTSYQNTRVMGVSAINFQVDPPRTGAQPLPSAEDVVSVYQSHQWRWG